MSYPYYETPQWYHCDACKLNTVSSQRYARWAYGIGQPAREGPLVCFDCEQAEVERNRELDELSDCGFEEAARP